MPFRAIRPDSLDALRALHQREALDASPRHLRGARWPCRSQAETRSCRRSPAPGAGPALPASPARTAATRRRRRRGSSVQGGPRHPSRLFAYFVRAVARTRSRPPSSTKDVSVEASTTAAANALSRTSAENSVRRVSALTSSPKASDRAVSTPSARLVVGWPGHARGEPAGARDRLPQLRADRRRIVDVGGDRQIRGARRAKREHAARPRHAPRAYRPRTRRSSQRRRRVWRGRARR